MGVGEPVDHAEAEPHGYRVLGTVPHNGPVGIGRKHMWKKDGED